MPRGIAIGLIWSKLAGMKKKRSERFFNKANTVSILLMSLCASQPLSAQLGGLLFEYQADNPRYSAESTPATSSQFLTLINAQGAAGKVRLGPRVLSDFSGGFTQDNIELFGCDLDRPTTYQYRLVDDVDMDDASAFIAELNSQGGQGFEFAGNLLLGDGSGGSGQEEAIIFMNEIGSAQTFEYKLIASAFGTLPIATFNAEGANGWEWLSAILFGGDTFNFFIRRPGLNESFSYSDELAEEGRAAFLAQLNFRGNQGQRWKGNFFTFDESGFTSFAVFVENSQENFDYEYSSLPLQSTRSSYIGQFNAQGQAGVYYNTEFVFQENDTSDFRVIFTTRSGSGGRFLLEGVFIFQNDDELAFTPEAAGDFRLYQSTNLVDFTPVGAAQMSAGETLTWSIDTTSAPSRFYRIEQE